MTWVALVQHLQLVAGLTWFGFVFNNAPSVLRVLRRQRRPGDAFLAATWFQACVQAGFTVRWLLNKTSIAAMPATVLKPWAALYALSALGSVLVVWSAGVETKDANHRTGLIVQIGALVFSVLIAGVV